MNASIIHVCTYIYLYVDRIICENQRIAIFANGGAETGSHSIASRDPFHAIFTMRVRGGGEGGGVIGWLG